MTAERGKRKVVYSWWEHIMYILLASRFWDQLTSVGSMYLWVLMTVLGHTGSVSSLLIESRAIFLPKKSTTDWLVKKHISQIRGASWSLLPVHHHSSVDWSFFHLRKIAPHSSSPSVTSLIHSVNSNHSYVRHRHVIPILCSNSSV